MHHKFLTHATELATQNVTENNGGPFGTVVVKDSAVIATGFNQVTSTNDPTAHAEIIAIRTACKKLNNFQLIGCTVYSSCEPCPMCLGALYWARPDAIYFASSRTDAANAGFDDSFIYEQIKIPYTQRTIPTLHQQIEGHTAPFLAWNENNKKISY